MKVNLAEDLKYIIEVVWRRRRLLILPLAILLPLTIAASYFLPRTYASRALLIMQEQGSDNPLMKTQTSTERIRERAPGLQALLKSERVLLNALRDIKGEDMPTDPRAIALELQDLDKQLSFEMVGSDFLDIQLKGAKSVGLGRQLEAITSRFLESMLTPDQDAMSATQVLQDKRKEDVVTAEKALAKFKDQIGERTLAAIAASQKRVAEVGSNTNRVEADIAATTTDIEQLKKSIGITADTRPEAAMEGLLRQGNVEILELEKRGAAGAPLIERARSKLVALRRIQAQEARFADLQRELNEVKRLVVDSQRAATDARTPEGQLRRLEKDLAEAKIQFETYLRRFPSATSSRSLQVLRAPERIRVIDAPRDPEFPLTSRLKYILAGAVAALLLSVGLAASAEALDQRVRRARDFENITGLPVVARLPAAIPEPVVLDEFQEPVPSPQKKASWKGNGSLSNLPILPVKPHQSAA